MFFNSSFVLFKVLSNSNMSEENAFEVEDICCEDFANISQVEELFQNVQKVDDFKIIVDSLILKIITGILFLSTSTFNNFHILVMIQFEKYGGDPMKRSVNNQLFSQIMFSGLLCNIICTPVLTWRIIWSPINSFIACFATIIENVYKSWIGICFTEMCIIKAMMVHKFPWVSGMDDNFMGTFFLICNLISLFLIHSARLWIGSMHESSEYQIYTGIKVSYENIFWSNFSIVMTLISGLTMISITWKKVKEQYKDYKYQSNIQINLQKEEDVESISGISFFNNMKHNPALLSGFQIAGVLFIGIILGITHTLISQHFKFDYLDYKAWLYPKLFLELFIFRIVLPILHIYERRDLRLFMKEYIP